MKVLVLDAMRRHLNSNPDIVQSVTEAFQRVSPPGCVFCATRWNLEAAADACRPDLILALSGRIWGELVPPLGVVRQRCKAMVGWWLTDDPYEIDGSLEWAGLTDFVATNNRESVPLYAGTNVIHVPLAADRKRHFRPVRSDDAAYQWDIAFCGVGFPNRRGWITAAAPLLARYKTLIVGPEWPDLPFVAPSRIDGSALTDLYNSSRIVLNLPRSLNLLNQHNFPASTPAPRTFEAAAAGGFQLAAADRPELHDYFDIPGEMDVFANAAELEERIQWYLTNPGQRIEAARKAQARTLRGHTYDHRATRILEYADTLRARSCGGTGKCAAPLRLAQSDAA
jgi:spore maturation protein CgeB